MIVAALGWALIAGLGMSQAASDEHALALFDVVPPSPSERSIPPRHRSHRPEGAAAPRNLKAKATEVVAPVPVVRQTVPPPPLLAAPIASIGSANWAGASNLPGPGTGAGGEGNGFGAGGSGDGDGGGAGNETPPKRIKGRIKDSDWPRGASESGAGGVVSVRYFVNVDGRPSDCRVTRSSGNADIDALTCRLIEQRFRYRPSLDEDGRPVRSIIVVDHEWINELGPAHSR